MTHGRVIFEDLKSLFNQYELHSASLLGSTFLEENILESKSDVDILILLEKKKDIIRFEKDVTQVLNNYSFQVIQGWGIVTKQFVGNSTIHLLLDTVNNFAKRSFFLRYSMSKYPSFYGSTLKQFEPRIAISKEILMGDEDGPFTLRQQLAEKNYTLKSYIINSAHEIKYIVRNEIYCNVVDMCFYTLLQSLRNVLRWLNLYNEFSTLKELSNSWSNNNLPEAQFVNDIIELKNNYKEGSFSLNSEEFWKESVDFMNKLCEYIKKRN